MSDGMEPLPENVDGTKTVSYVHKTNHKIDWGYVAIGAAVIVTVLVLQEQFVDTSGDDDEGGVDGGMA